MTWIATLIATCYTHCGHSWPTGLWEARRRPGSFGVLLERAAPQGPLEAQLASLEMVRKGSAGEAAALLTLDEKSLCQGAARIPSRLMVLGAGSVSGARATHQSGGAVGQGSPPPDLPLSPMKDLEQLPLSPMKDLEQLGDLPLSPMKDLEQLGASIVKAISLAKSRGAFVPNPSQEEAIAWALGRRLSLIRGPPGTGKTRTAALLISSALKLSSSDRPELTSSPRAPKVLPVPRVLAVAHSNGAADVLLAALMHLGVPAVRAGRPATVGPAVRHRTALALADQHPEVMGLRRQAQNVSLAPHERSAVSAKVRDQLPLNCHLIAA